MYGGRLSLFGWFLLCAHERMENEADQCAPFELIGASRSAPKTTPSAASAPMDRLCWLDDMEKSAADNGWPERKETKTHPSSLIVRLEEHDINRLRVRAVPARTQRASCFFIFLRSKRNFLSDETRPSDSSEKKNGKREKWNGGKWRPSKCCRSKFKWRRPSWSVRLPMATRWLARTSTPSANRSTKKANRQSARSPFETAEIERERERERENNSRTKGPGVCVCVCVCVCARGVDRPVGRIETPSLAGNVCQTVSVPQKKKNFWPGNPMMRTMIGRRPSIVPQSAAPRTARWNAHSSRAAVGHCSDEGHHEGFFFGPV